MAVPTDVCSSYTEEMYVVPTQRCMYVVPTQRCMYVVPTQRGGK